MKARWLICNLGKDDNIQQLFYGVQECGRESEVVSLKEFAERMETPSYEVAPVVTCGSIWMNGEIRKKRPNWTGNWHDPTLYTCQKYYSHWGKHLTQRDYVMLPYSELARRKEWIYKLLGNEDGVFLRPDSGEKEFVGEVVSSGRFKAWAEYSESGELQAGHALRRFGPGQHRQRVPLRGQERQGRHRIPLSHEASHHVRTSRGG